jgi:hypothetical protein
LRARRATTSKTAERGSRSTRSHRSGSRRPSHASPRSATSDPGRRLDERVPEDALHDGDLGPPKDDADEHGAPSPKVELLDHRLQLDEHSRVYVQVPKPKDELPVARDRERSVVEELLAGKDANSAATHEEEDRRPVVALQVVAATPGYSMTIT